VQALACRFCFALTEKIQEFSWRKHFHSPHQANWKMAEVARDDALGGHGQSHFKKRVVIGIGQGMRKRKPGNQYRGAEEMVKQVGDEVVFKRESRAMQHLFVLNHQTRVEAKPEIARGEHPDDLSARRKWREESRDENVGIENYVHLARSRRAFLISASISFKATLSSPRSTERA